MTDVVINNEDGRPTETEDPEEIEESPDVRDAPPIANWPWWATAITAAVALLAVLAIMGAGWIYILQHNEAQERADWEQLLNLIDRVQSIALFVLGAILGVSATGASAKGAAAAADNNKKEAEKQHDRAKKNEQAAAKNKQVAKLAQHDALAAVDRLEDYVNRVQANADVDELAATMPDVATIDTSELDLGTFVTDYVDRSDAGTYTIMPHATARRLAEGPDSGDLESWISEVRDKWA